MVSVLIPVFQVPVLWFKDAINSTLNELRTLNSKSSEIVISVDGTDQEDLIEYLKELESDDLTFSFVWNDTNLGVAGALNAGLEICRNDRVARMDADDIMLPGRLKAQMLYMNQNPQTAVVGTGLNYMYENAGQWYVSPDVASHPEIITRELAKTSAWFMNHPTVMMSKRQIVSCGMYDDQLKGMSEDFELWMRLIRHNKNLRNLPQSYHYLRINPKSASRNFNSENSQMIQTLQAKL